MRASGQDGSGCRGVSEDARHAPGSCVKLRGGERRAVGDRCRGCPGEVGASLRNGQRAVDKSEGVVRGGEGSRRGGDGIGSGRGGGGGGGGQAGRAGDNGGSVSVDVAADGVGEGWVGGSIGAAGVGCRHCQNCRGDGDLHRGGAAGVVGGVGGGAGDRQSLSASSQDRAHCRGVSTGSGYAQAGVQLCRTQCGAIGDRRRRCPGDRRGSLANGQRIRIRGNGFPSGGNVGRTRMARACQRGCVDGGNRGVGRIPGRRRGDILSRIV